jgi:hypothetical protein
VAFVCVCVGVGRGQEIIVGVFCLVFRIRELPPPPPPLHCICQWWCDAARVESEKEQAREMERAVALLVQTVL